MNNYGFAEVVFGMFIMFCVLFICAICPPLMVIALGVGLCFVIGDLF